MKTLILYASKYGAAGEIARRLAQKMGNATVCDLKQGNIPPLDGFDCVIVGSSVYAGALRKEAKAFVAKNAAALVKKTLGLYISSLGADISFFNKNYPPGFFDTAKAKGFLGGIFDPEKAGTAERLIIRAITKQSGYISTIDDEAIDQFVAAIKAET
jgi:menaquinone-dependent protoporphyrinogen oxidase